MDKNQVTIVQNAIDSIDGFEKVFQVIYQQSVLQGKSKSTFNNYIRRIALISLHFKALPENISDDEITDYLTALALKSNSPSRSSFKHMVYGLRFYFRHIGLNKRAIALPSLKKDMKLPVILNRTELRQLFASPTYLKHRIVLTLIYSAGLRAQEVINLKLGDIDFERKTIHIRQSKYKKDRVVPLAEFMAKGLKKYIAVENPHIWLFNGKELDGRYSVKGLSWVMREALKKTQIQKQVNLHSLRHSYATHLLEDGVNIVVIKNLLGHSNIDTTMVYLHVAQLPNTPPHSPLDTLYPAK
jgi:integrase/recombinase XerD